MERLFTEGGAYSKKANVISQECFQALVSVMNQHINVDIRDLMLVVESAAQEATLCMILDRKTDW